jgi:hypothetical protein
MIAPNDEYTLNLYGKRKPRPRTQSLRRPRPIRSQNCGSILKWITTTLWQKHVSAPEFFLFEPANTPIIQMEEGEDYVLLGWNCQKRVSLVNQSSGIETRMRFRPFHPLEM